MTNTNYAIPEYATAKDIKRVREKLNMSQREFALLINVSKPTIERWEASKDKINGPSVLLLYMIENNIEYLDTIKIPEKKYPIRLYYMNNQMICTIIDVNVIKQEVSIKNFTNDIMFRAFGKNEKPTFQEDEEFLIMYLAQQSDFSKTLNLKIKLLLLDYKTWNRNF